MGRPSYVVVSLGSIGRRHLRNLRQLVPDAEITVVRRSGAPVDEDRLADRHVDSVETALEAGHMDAAIIASPAPFHVGDALPLIETGVPTLIEKPLSHDPEDAGRLLAAQRRSGACVMVAYVLRYNECLIRFREALLDGTLAHPFHVEAMVGQHLSTWRPGTDHRKSVSGRSDMGGGVLLELSHELDYLRWCFGEPENLVATTANTGRLGIDVADNANILMQYGDSLSISLHMDFLQKRPSRYCRVLGDNGILCCDFIKRRVIFEPEDQDQAPQILFEDREEDRNAPYMNMLSDFLSRAKENMDSPIPLADGERTLALVAAAKRSSDLGAQVKCI